MITAQDAHSAERMILVGCDDAQHASYAQVLRLSAFKPEHWAAVTKDWLASHVMFDTVSLSLFVEPHFRPMFEDSGLERIVSEHYQQARINTNTVANRSEQQGINVVKNLKRIADGHGVDALRALPSMRGQTAVVCGAGPSLDDCYEFLARHDGPIVAVNTSAAAVLHTGCLKPDLIVCSESKQLEEWKVGCFGTTIPVAMDLMSHPTHPEGVGPALYFASMDPSLAPAARVLGMRPIGYGPSCTTAAVSLCLALGAEKVLLVGQDCAFGPPHADDDDLTLTDHRMYATGTPYAETRVRIDHFPRRATIDKPTKGESQADAVQVEGVDGKPVWTMPSMLSFMHWFRDQPESVRACVVNCSSHGVKLEGIGHRPLSECVQTGNAYDGTLQDTSPTSIYETSFNGEAANLIGYLQYQFREDLKVSLYSGELADSPDWELVEASTKVPLTNYWTNPAKLRAKLENARVDPYTYGKAIANAVRKAWSDIREVLG